MQLRAGNSGPVVAFMQLAAALAQTVLAGGHLDVAVPLVGAQLGDTPLVDLVPTAGTVGLIPTGATVALADTVTIRVENPTAAPITADLAFSVLVLRTGQLAP